jgi:quercetin dioxygenase-like cupin family protein
MKKSEDNRRTLIEWIENAPIRSCKIIIAKDYTEIGGHYHNNKYEWFYVLSGFAQYSLNNGDYYNFEEVIYIPKGVKHTFKLTKGTVMLGAASQPFDINDEIK